MLMSAREFDRAEFVDGYRHEVIHGILVISPFPPASERDANDELGYLLRAYHHHHPEGVALNATLHEHTVRTRENRRRADRVIWAGLGRRPRRRDTPTIVVDFVSTGKRDRPRDYGEKYREYLARGVEEYWILDRFRRILTVCTRRQGKVKRQVVRERKTYKTNLLPGFELPLAQLFALADSWTEEDEDPWG
jgi:Uma2 family endonuclease